MCRFLLAEPTQLGDARFHALWTICLVFSAVKIDVKLLRENVVKVSVPVVADHACRGEVAATDPADMLPTLKF